MIRRALTVLLLGLGIIMLVPSSAQAIPNPLDCKSEPTITTPTTGAPGWLDAGPEHPRQGDPFAKDAKVTVYEVYGWGGLTWPNYDLGCGPDAARDPSSTGAGVIAGFMWSSLLVACAAATSVIRWAFDPDTLGLLEPIQRLAADAFGNAVFMPLFFLTLTATGIFILAKSHRGDVRTAANSAGWIGLVMIAALAATLWPTAIAPHIDRTVTGIVSTVSGAVSGDTSGEGGTMADAVAGTLQRGILFETWKAGQFGRSNSATADKYGPALFKAGTLTRAEVATIKKDPSKTDGIVETHRNRYKEIAEKIKDEDPEAYEYLAGARNNDRAVSAGLAWTGFWCAMLFLVVAALLVLFGLIVLRVAIMAVPLLAVIGGFPPMRKILLGTFDYVLGALVSSVAFGSFAVVMAAAMGRLLGPASGVHPALAALLLLVFTVVAWRLSKPFRSVKTFLDLRRSAQRTVTVGPQPQTVPDGWGGETPVRAPEPTVNRTGRPAEAGTRVVVGKAALTGAVQGAIGGLAAGAVTGGTATIGSAAAGAARGAAVAGIGSGTAHVTGSRAAGAIAATATGRAAAPDSRSLPAAPTPLPASPAEAAPSNAVSADAPVKLYEPGKPSPADALTPATPAVQDGQLVYDLYAPTARVDA